ncbi:MlaA family lipoprotein [Thiohalomonas denitrificans]|uniref:Phospholipid-binding lipoprotein MlaA n=1 Tax=Thiohalomonas denitrificans TaxID=415747 RepID=A0A1G5PML9_9GAMM|nr:VacJ family lipoprotein [Thiohalomonas denitrificans]SCZ50586.1 phospholipid-binding lipoprotein MlaA [Thiohalomonas denitrificans]
MLPTRTPAMAGILLLLAGAAGAQEAWPEEPNDPLEGFNRAVYRFNDAFDQALLKPVAQTYQDVLPRPVNRGISNFFGNLDDVVTLVNNLLQFKFKQAVSDAGRITFNTTVGLGGLIDVATPMDFLKHNEDFGQTLGYWGVGSGPYLVLPFLGPSTLRDGFGRIPDGYAYPAYHLGDDTTRWSLIGLEAVDTRAGLLRASRVLDQAALDPYGFMRDSYLQRRQSLIHDGSPPMTDSDPFLDDSFLDDSFLDEPAPAASGEP